MSGPIPRGPSFHTLAADLIADGEALLPEITFGGTVQAAHIRWLYRAVLFLLRAR